MYGTANDPQNGLQMISSTASSPHCRPQMIHRGKLEWLGLKLLDHRVTLIIATKSINYTKLIELN